MTSISGFNGSTTSSTTSTGGALLSSAGIGSGLNVDDIVNALVGDKKAGPAKQISAQATRLQAQQAGLTALSGVLTSMQTALDKLASSITYNTYGATFGDDTLGSATTLPNAKSGSYNLTVDHLATAQKRASGSYASGSPVGAGTLTISVGDKSVDIDVSDADSISAIATAINNASDNPGVQATVVNGTGGAQLLLTSTKTGVANGFSVSASGGSSSGLASLASALDTAGANEATDASLSIDGIAVTSASNAVSGALEGVTLNLTDTGTTTLTVAQDTGAVEDAISAFVDAYNSYASTVGTLSSYDVDTQAAGVLLGDTTLTSLQRQIAGVLSGRAPGNPIGSLAALGITRDADGKLELDKGKLDGLLKTNPAAVQDLFAGDDGYATRLNSAIDGFTASDGIIATRNASLEKQLGGLSDKSAALDARMAVYEAQLRAQYTALDTLMASLDSTSNYLASSLKQLEAAYTHSDN